MHAVWAAMLLLGEIRGGDLPAPVMPFATCAWAAAPGAHLAEGPHGHLKRYPAHTRWMVRYTYKHGIHYSRPADYRTLLDYPWHSRERELYLAYGPPPWDAPGQPAWEEELLPPDATPLARGVERPYAQVAEPTSAAPRGNPLRCTAEPQLRVRFMPEQAARISSSQQSPPQDNSPQHHGARRSAHKSR